MLINDIFWKKYFHYYDCLNNLIPYQELVNKIVDIINPQPEEFILDIGSGTGNIYEKIFVKNSNIFGLDFSDEAIKIHKSKNSKCKVFKFDVRSKLPFGDNYFDKVFSNNTIYLLDQRYRESIFLEVKRILKPGGLFLVSNISRSFNPLKIYKDHMLKSYNKIGLISTLLNSFKFVIPTIMIFYYNLILKISSFDKEISFFSINEQTELLISAGFDNISNNIVVYSGQAVMNYGFKNKN